MSIAATRLVGSARDRGGLPAASALAAAPAGAAKSAKEAAKASPSRRRPSSPARRGAGKAGERDLTLRGGEEITAFGSLTVEGEDRIHVEFDRPALELAIDPATAPGLDWGSPTDVLMRRRRTASGPFLELSAQDRSP